MKSALSVSTVIPAYNAATVVARAIESALAQQADQEIIVVDDGSTDATANRVRRYGAKVTLIQQPNGGVSAARNRGIAEAQGDIVAFLDADDVWYPDKLSKQLALFAADPEIGTVICDEAHVTEDGTVIKPSYLASRAFADELPKTPGRLATPVTWLVRQPFFPTSSVATRADLLRQAGRFDESLSIVEDRDMWLRLALKAPVGLVPQVLLDYLTGQTDSLTAKASETRWASALATVIARLDQDIVRAVSREGTDADRLLAGVYRQIAQTHWYNGNYDAAGAAFGQTLAHGDYQNALKWLACRSGLAHALVELKRVVFGQSNHKGE